MRYRIIVTDLDAQEAEDLERLIKEESGLDLTECFRVETYDGDFGNPEFK